MQNKAGYQRHPGTKTAHFFAEGSAMSACKREMKTTGDVIDSTHFMVCSWCEKKMVRLEHENRRGSHAAT